MSITIRRFSSVYHCTTGQDAGLRLRDRLDGLARRHIGKYLQEMSAPLMQGEEGAVWLVRRLEIDCTINTAWNDEAISRAWAKKVVLALSSAVAEGGNEDVLRFENAAAYLASFVTDLARGNAWNKWYYRRFAGLSALSYSGAIRSALVQGHLTGASALRTLSAVKLGLVLDALSPDDALLVLRMCAGLTDPYQVEDAALVAAPHARGANRYPPEDPRWGLGLFVEASREADGGGAVLLSAIAALAVQLLLPGVATAGPGTSSSLPHWVELLGGVSALAHLPRGLVTRPDLPVADGAEIRHTPFGGGFLLLPMLIDRPLDDWVGEWPELAQVVPARALGALVLARCLGGARSLRFLRDPLWLEVLGLPTDVDWHAVTRELSALRAPSRRALRADLKAQALEYGAGSCVESVVWGGGRTWRLHCDAAQYWHRLVPARGALGATERDPDLEYLANPAEFSPSPGWDALLSLAAQHMLRRFAGRLPGFSRSHFDYLYGNFLAMSARVEREGERYLVRLSRPPLALMLNLTGMTRTEYELPWHTGRSCALFSDE